MNSKKIANIVFYKYYDGRGEEKQVCIFYDDGTVENVSYDAGIDACEKVAKENNIKTKNAFKEMINNNIVHVVTGKYLEENWDKYIVNKDLTHEDMEEVVEEESFNNEVAIPPITVTKNKKAAVADTEGNDEDIYEDEDDFDDIDDYKSENDEEDMFEEDIDDSVCAADATIDDSIDEEIEDQFATEVTTDDKKKGSFFRRKIVAFAAAIALALGGASCSALKTKSGKIEKNNISTSSNDGKDDKDSNKIQNLSINNTDPATYVEDTKDDVVTKNNDVKKSNKTKRDLVKGNNDLYDDYTYEELLEVTENKTQKTAMSNLYTTINEFNGEFASHYAEALKIKGKKMTVKPALKFDELVSLQVAYNKYNKTELKAYFNGAEVDSEKMTRAYKDASLQLMGAYAIETKENQLDMSYLIESEEGKEFYQRYHKMFIEAKTATGKDKLKKVKKFYKAVKKDFPVTQKVRTEGIAHADTYASIEDYKLAVTPMIAAAEMMFQNLSKDYTLTDSQINFINDIGLCNYAEEKFEKVETISIVFEEDNTNPLYEQYRNAIIKEMKEKNQYAVADDHRELTNLRSFQEAVNWHFEMIDGAEWSYHGGFYSTSTTRTETETWTETSTSYREETTYTEKPITAEAKAQIDAEDAAYNAEQERIGYQQAEEERKRQQAIEDENAQRIREEVARDEKQFHEDIDRANQKIKDNNRDNDPSNDTPVNESDFTGYEVDFDRNHSDENGNLDKSVEDITTDPTGDQTGQELPDPNETGRKFDAQADNYNYTETYDNTGYTDTYNEQTNDGVYTEYVSDDAYIEFPSEYSYGSTSGQTYVEYEDAVDSYINSMTSNQADDYGYQYTR